MDDRALEPNISTSQLLFQLCVITACSFTRSLGKELKMSNYTSPGFARGAPWTEISQGSQKPGATAEVELSCCGRDGMAHRTESTYYMALFTKTSAGPRNRPKPSFLRLENWISAKRSVLPRAIRGLDNTWGWTLSTLEHLKGTTLFGGQPDAPRKGLI